MNNISLLNKKSCVSCRSCEYTCPKNCISFCEDDCGFIYPEVSENCIDCGLCVNHCPILGYKKDETKKRIVKAMILKDDSLLLKSSSGGVFVGIAEYVLEKNGIVFGASFDQDFNVKQTSITSKNELYLLQGSKYVASDTETSFIRVKEFLEKGKLVLYSGLPCQIAGLRAFLNKNYENLICLDLICHGVPSATFFKEYLKRIEKKTGKKIKAFSFRDKQINDGWGHKKNYVLFEDGTSKKISIALDYYYSSFLFCESFRESCYTCKYANIDRIGDVTIGDFWGFRNFYKGKAINYRKGVSVCIFNTEKGLTLLNDIQNKFFVFDSSIEDCIVENGNLKKPSQRPVIRDFIYQRIESPFFRLKILFSIKKIKWVLIKLIKQCIPLWLLKIIRKIRK